MSRFRARSGASVWILILCLSLLVSCAKDTVVTVGGTPVTNEAFVTATRSVHQGEVASVAIGDFLIQRHKESCGSLNADEKLTVAACVTATTHLKAYATQYAPAILIALTTARDTLRLVATNPGQVTQDTINNTLAVLASAVSKAAGWAAQHGYIQPSMTP